MGISWRTCSQHTGKGTTWRLIFQEILMTSFNPSIDIRWFFWFFWTLSSAFDTVDHQILLHCLFNRLGITGLALQWLRSYMYLDDRAQIVSIGNTQSDSQFLDCGVPQALSWALFFSLYIHYHWVILPDITTSSSTCTLMTPSFTCSFYLVLTLKHHSTR